MLNDRLGCPLRIVLSETLAEGGQGSEAPINFSEND